MGAKYKWGIRRVGREFVDESYQGPLWKKIHETPVERFDTKRNAAHIAELLTEVSRTGSFEAFPFT